MVSTKSELDADLLWCIGLEDMLSSKSGIALGDDPGIRWRHTAAFVSCSEQELRSIAQLLFEVTWASNEKEEGSLNLEESVVGAAFSPVPTWKETYYSQFHNDLLEESKEEN